MGETYRAGSGREAPARPADVAPGGVPAYDPYAGWLDRPLRLALECLATGDVPVGAVLVDGRGQVVGEGRNTRERDQDPGGHAELLALRAAAAERGSWRLDGYTLVVTLEPCPMCAGAAMLSRVDRIVFGAWDPKLGACGSVWDIPRDRQATHRPEVVGGVREQECGALLREFFVGHREER